MSHDDGLLAGGPREREDTAAPELNMSFDSTGDGHVFLPVEDLAQPYPPYSIPHSLSLTLG